MSAWLQCCGILRVEHNSNPGIDEYSLCTYDGLAQYYASKKEFIKTVKKIIGPVHKGGEDGVVFTSGSEDSPIMGLAFKKPNDIDNDFLDSVKLPMGSEGSLEYDILYPDHLSGCIVVSIPIYGSLRDVEDTDYVNRRMDAILKEFKTENIVVRDFVMRVSNGSSAVILHSQDSGSIIAGTVS
jgi:hypothetical protein